MSKEVRYDETPYLVGYGSPYTLAVSACGGGAGGEQQQPKARPLPDSSQDLRPGEYRTEYFKPALSFTVGKGWALECPAGDDNVCLLPQESRRCSSSLTSMRSTSLAN